MEATIKDELRELVDALEDEQATEVIEFIQLLRTSSLASGVTGADRLHLDAESSEVSAREHVGQPAADRAALLQQESTKPPVSFDALIALSGFAPDDETADDFDQARREWRRENRRG